MLTFTQAKTKFQRLTMDTTPNVLTQGIEDINTAYHKFNAQMTRYYTRKQQFTNLIAGQQVYQLPIDSIRITGMTVLVSNTYQPPVKEVRNEYDWRQMTSYPYKTNWPAYYFSIGANQFGLWPTPSQTVTNGLRIYYQLQDHDLAQDDVTSVTTGYTVSVTNGSTTVTASGSAFTSNMIGWEFRITATAGVVSDNTWYTIVGVPNGTTLTLESAYVGSSASGLAWQAGQSFIFPQEYHDAPIHYAASLYFMARGNSARAKFHMDIYEKDLAKAIEEYSSANSSSVIDTTENYLNPWTVLPVPSS